jgi:hypothetical protein
MMSEDFKVEVSDSETWEWISKLSDADKQELKRRALEQNAVMLLQPKAEPNLGAMEQAEFERYKRSIGL